MEQADGSADSYRHIISDAFYPSEVRRPPDGSPVSAQFATRRSGIFRKTVGRTRHSQPVLGRRSWRDIERRTADEYLLLCPLSGEIAYTQFGRQCVVDKSKMVLIDAQAPYGFERRLQGGMVCHHVPGPILREAGGRVQDLCAAAIRIDKGLGHMVKSLFDTAWRDIDMLGEEEQRLVMRMIASLLASACSTASPLARPEPPGNRTVDRRAMDHIDRCLDDPELDVNRIARAIGVSVSHLHAAMKKRGTTVGRTILARRLERCAANLRAPEGKDARISDIAFRWGFQDAAHFSRSFKAHFSSSPSDYRDAAHAG